LAQAIMLVGTASHVGKSVLCTALCRILAQDGWSVAPFKAQNMSLNSAVTPDGKEIGRAQAVQAEAAGVAPTADMNPVLLKPTGPGRTQVVVQGAVCDTVSAREYFMDDKAGLWSAVVQSYERLSSAYAVVVIEGAGSPVELNLKQRDIANMRVADLADAHVLLVADIDRGGVFASVAGTLQLLQPAERARVKGVIVNRFQGDLSLFTEGARMLSDLVGIPVLGVIPYIEDLAIDEEDSLGLGAPRYRRQRAQQRGVDDSVAKDGSGPRDYATVAIVRFPHIANFTDVDPLFAEQGFDVHFTVDPDEVRMADAIVLPGTKNTMDDLAWLWESGLAAAVREACAHDAHCLGICGGYQMLGTRVCDPDHVEAMRSEQCGLGLLPCETTLQTSKRTTLVEATLAGAYAGIAARGYEIHMGLTRARPGAGMHFASTRRGGDPPDTDEGGTSDGLQAADGRIVGTYLHGILHENAFRSAWLARVQSRAHKREGAAVRTRCTRLTQEQQREAEYDRLAAVVRMHLDVAAIESLLRESTVLPP